MAMAKGGYGGQVEKDEKVEASKAYPCLVLPYYSIMGEQRDAGSYATD